MQHHATSNNDAAMRRRAMSPSHPAGCAILRVALLPALRRIKTAGNVNLRDCAKLYAQRLAEVQHDQAIAVRGLPVAAPAHPGNANGARDEFGLCESSWHLTDARESGAMPGRIKKSPCSAYSWRKGHYKGSRQVS